MKKYLLLIGSCVVFFVFGTATSADTVDLEYQADVIIQGGNLILSSADERDIENAFLLILEDNDDVLDAQAYSRGSYNLDAMDTDTLPLASFVSRDTVAFPDTSIVRFFSLEFFVRDTGYFFSRTL